MGVFTKILDKEKEFLEEQYRIKILEKSSIWNISFLSLITLEKK